VLPAAGPTRTDSSKCRRPLRNHA